MQKKRKNDTHPILIVDDNPVVLRLLDAMLHQAGYQVIQATSGQQALVLLDSVVPDLILLDIEMPGLSGFDTCRQIKANPRTVDIPVLFVTASEHKKDIVAGFAAGAQDYLIKPVSKEELLARVSTHQALCATQRELKASRAKYRELSYLDDLTGFYNTRYLYKTLQAQLDKHPDRPITVAFLDIDSFKQVVDRHGHLNGSQAIAELAAVIKPLLPKGSYGISYGGDEFVLVLTGHERISGEPLVERVRTAIAGHAFLTTQGLSLSLTVSCGLAAYPSDAGTLVDLLGTADHALFAAKRGGKNTVTAFADISTRN